MRVPFITSHRRSIAEPESQQVSRRASTRPVGSITFWGANRTVSAYSPGDSVTSRSIQDGSPFADRTAGGGDRSLIYGSRFVWRYFLQAPMLTQDCTGLMEVVSPPPPRRRQEEFLAPASSFTFGPSSGPFLPLDMGNIFITRLK